MVQECADRCVVGAPVRPRAGCAIWRAGIQFYGVVERWYRYCKEPLIILNREEYGTTRTQYGRGE